MFRSRFNDNVTKCYIPLTKRFRGDSFPWSCLPMKCITWYLFLFAFTFLRDLTTTTANNNDLTFQEVIDGG